MMIEIQSKRSSGAGQPFNLTAFNGLITAKNTAVNTRQQEEGQFRVAVVGETNSYDDCDDEARRLLNLAIATHGVDSPNLVLIGWGPPAAATATFRASRETWRPSCKALGLAFWIGKRPPPVALRAEGLAEAARKRLPERSAFIGSRGESAPSRASRRKIGASGR
ncbi:MAG: hypothetical protein QY327_11575 [Fimbriimonadaceae bacterium]|nr:MAG: hypothetical protein UZ18_ATM001000864 [Armatimonadetes bacterium OLB18]WKZ79968.1 MAG: hypothetical protein QY327_11575 [Fimbriimonadaceae bacterium]